MTPCPEGPMQIISTDMLKKKLDELSRPPFCVGRHHVGFSVKLSDEKRYRAIITQRLGAGTDDGFSGPRHYLVTQRIVTT